MAHITTFTDKDLIPLSMMNNKKKITALGIDGSHFGWCVVMLDSLGNSFMRLVKNIDEIFDTTADIAVIDVPIGLIDSGDERICDIETRQALEKRRSSVFHVPCREALYAETQAEASIINERRTGRRISPYSWGIVPKIREVDEFMRKNPEKQGFLYESHPELCFAKLIGHPCENNKKDQCGENERVDVLEKHMDIQSLLRNHPYSSKDVARDDIVDAAVLALVGLMAVKNNKFKLLPESSEIDEAGLRMQMLIPD